MCLLIVGGWTRKQDRFTQRLSSSVVVHGRREVGSLLHEPSRTAQLDVAGVRAAFFQIALMVILSFIESSSRDDLCDYGALELRLPAFLRSPRSFLLLRRVEEDSRAILRTEVGTLAVQCGGIVHLPKVVQKCVIRNFLWIEADLECLGMPGAVSTNVSISR